MLLSSRMRGEAKEIAKPIVAVGEEIATTGNPVDPPAVFLWGGESTVTISENSGIGGPNQEFALSAALELGEDMVLAAIDTDGEDGSSEVAGAIVDTETVNDSARVRSCLEDNDAGTYLADENTRIRTGPTGTNVNDVIVGVIPETST